MAGFLHQDGKFDLNQWFMVAGADIRPILTCFIGIMLAIALNKLTSYYTHTTHEPGKDLGAGLPDGPCHEHHPGLCLGL